MTRKTRQLALTAPLSLRLTLGGLPQGRKDPCATWIGPDLWRATRSPEGPVTTRLRATRDTVTLDAWGTGADWAAQHLPELIGNGQVLGPYAHPLIDGLHRQLAGMRVPKTRAVFEALLFTVLAQRVTSMEAVGSYQRIVRHCNDPAPSASGGPQLFLPPSPEQLIGLPSWLLHRFGVDRNRAETLRVAARCARRIEETPEMTPGDARKRLEALPGIGVWTTAEVAHYSLGDPDAVSVGDYHLKNQVVFALSGRVRGSDDEMLELLELFRGFRGHVSRLIARAHPRPPAFGPRYSPLPVASM